MNTTNGYVISHEHELRCKCLVSKGLSAEKYFTKNAGLCIQEEQNRVFTEGQEILRLWYEKSRQRRRGTAHDHRCFESESFMIIIAILYLIDPDFGFCPPFGLFLNCFSFLIFLILISWSFYSLFSFLLFSLLFLFLDCFSLTPTGSFILQFLLLSLFFGVPLLLFLCSLGQYLGSGYCDIWFVTPAFRGKQRVTLLQGHEYMYCVIHVYLSLRVNFCCTRAVFRSMKTSLAVLPLC